MCMTGVHIYSTFCFCLYSNLSTSGGVKICSLCPQLYINVMLYCSILCICVCHKGALKCKLQKTSLRYYVCPS